MPSRRASPRTLPHCKVEALYELARWPEAEHAREQALALLDTRERAWREQAETGRPNDELQLESVSWQFARSELDAVWQKNQPPEQLGNRSSE
jgi:hypothetical protein